MRAICKDDFKELKKALDDGFDIDAPVELEKDRTALGLAAFLNRPKLLQYLILRGASLEKPDKYGSTPLMDSVERVNYECMLKLVENGAEISKSNMFLESAITKAEAKNYEAIKSYLDQVSNEKERKILLPSHTVRFKFERDLHDKKLHTKRYSKGHTYVFNSLTKSYAYSMYTESDKPL